jgi:hypothetical protein
MIDLIKGNNNYKIVLHFTKLDQECLIHMVDLNNNLYLIFKKIKIIRIKVLILHFRKRNLVLVVIFI